MERTQWSQAKHIPAQGAKVFRKSKKRTNCHLLWQQLFTDPVYVLDNSPEDVSHTNTESHCSEVVIAILELWFTPHVDGPRIHMIVGNATHICEHINYIILEQTVPSWCWQVFSKKKSVLLFSLKTIYFTPLHRQERMKWKDHMYHMSVWPYDNVINHQGDKAPQLFFTVWQLCELSKSANLNSPWMGWLAIFRGAWLYWSGFRPGCL